MSTPAAIPSKRQVLQEIRDIDRKEATSENLARRQGVKRTSSGNPFKAEKTNSEGQWEKKMRTES
jgi:hypothetical protein